MANQNRTEAVDYRARAQYGSAAPVRQPRRQPEPRRQVQPKVVTRSKKEIRAEEYKVNGKAFRVVLACTILFMLIGFQIYSQVKVDEINREIANVNSKIEVVESENTRLNMELDSRISLDKVDDYAQNVLGMVKVENYQVSYVDFSGGDTVTISGGKQHTNLIDKIKEAF